MDRVPCTFKEVKNVNGVHIGYRVYFDLLLVEAVSDSVIPFQPYLFTSIADMIDNRLLAQECGLGAVSIAINFIVTSKDFPDFYKSIVDYVSRSNSH